jgi:hypothetical protein
MRTRFSSPPAGSAHIVGVYLGDRAWKYGRVLEDLEAAARAYREAQATAGQAEQELAEAKAGVPAARARLAAAIVKASRAGVRQRDIVATTGYTRESVRRILRAGGVAPDEDLAMFQKPGWGVFNIVRLGVCTSVGQLPLGVGVLCGQRPWSRG